MQLNKVSLLHNFFINNLSETTDDADLLPVKPKPHFSFCAPRGHFIAQESGFFSCSSPDFYQLEAPIGLRPLSSLVDERRKNHGQDYRKSQWQVRQLSRGTNAPIGYNLISSHMALVLDWLQQNASLLSDTRSIFFTQDTPSTSSSVICFRR